jgi:DNA gyrase subunit A
MAKKKKETKAAERVDTSNIEGLHAEILEQPIVDTLELNYMPYAMSVIVSRAIPEIDGFKPSHRKLLYTMYKMGLLTGARSKSANIVGRTMQLNPHGDAAIYETMVRLSKGNEALLAPFVDSKGNFGKVYSRDMAYAASRYTEAKLAPICAELFKDIDKDTVDLVDNYDGTMKEPSLLPTSFPNVLVSSNQGIAVGMASMMCGFNLEEVCRATIEYIKNPDCDLLETLKAPDFSTGGELIYNREALQQLYSTGRGSVKLRAVWNYIKEENLIEIKEIPYSTTVEAIIDKVAELIKAGKLKEISDMRDETDLGGLKIAIDLKRGTDPDKLMQKLFKMTPLLDSYSCNFNILISGMPRVMGVGEIIEEWTAWRTECVRRRTYFDLTKKKEKLHLLKGLAKILLDIDKAIKIIRETELESDVVPNLMIGFGIDETQAEFVAEIKLRNINREYILKRTQETESLEKDIEDLEDIVNSKARIRKIIISELEEVIKKYAEPRRTKIVYENEINDELPEMDEVEDYPVSIFMSRHGYFKKITPQSLRMNSEQKYKEEDEAFLRYETSNRAELLVFTDKCMVYKARLADFEDTKASALGVFLPAKLQMDENETPVFMLVPGDYSGSLLFFYENGKVGRVLLSSYATKTNRKKLMGAYSDKAPLCTIMQLEEECEIVISSTEGRALIFNSAQLAPKAARDTQGVSVMNLKTKYHVKDAKRLDASALTNHSRYRARSIPAAGAIVKPEDMGEEQITIF